MMMLCEHCGLCAEICPMGAIDPNDPSNIPGTCIKCCACTTYCPSGAKKFDDPDFLSHTAMLEQFRTEARKENSIFFCKCCADNRNRRLGVVYCPHKANDRKEEKLWTSSSAISTTRAL